MHIGLVQIIAVEVANGVSLGLEQLKCLKQT